MHTHAVEAAAQTPYLSIRSPEKQSGKTRLLEILELLCARAKLWTLPSEAVTFRTIERDQPTLLLDEIDTIWTDKGNEHEGLRALLNSGNRRGTTVPRCVGPSQALHEFPVFCAKALAGIGAPPDTVADRSIPISLKRRTRDEKIERFRQRDRARTVEGPALRERLAEWAKAHEEELAESWPDLPEELSDREQDAAEPLLAIADLAAGPWPNGARAALTQVVKGSAGGNDDSLRLRLLSDTRRAFAQAGFPRRMRSADLVTALCGLEDGPWAEGLDKPLSQAKMAFLLKDYGVDPKQIRFSSAAGDTGKGYHLEPLQDAWARYLPEPDYEAESKQEEGSFTFGAGRDTRRGRGCFELFRF